MSEISGGQSTPLHSYTLASADEFYEAIGLRVIYVQDDPQGGIRIWGESPEEDTSTAANLSQMLLEYALSCDVPGAQEWAFEQMEAFGEHLGKALADWLRETMPSTTAEQRAIRGLEGILNSMDIPFAVERTADGWRYVLDHYPLRDAAEPTGLRGELELAHRALNALCHSLINELDPDLEIQTPAEPGVQVPCVLKVRETKRPGGSAASDEK